MMTNPDKKRIANDTSMFRLHMMDVTGRTEEAVGTLKKSTTELFKRMGKIETKCASNHAAPTLPHVVLTPKSENDEQPELSWTWKKGFKAKGDFAIKALIAILLILLFLDGWGWIPRPFCSKPEPAPERVARGNP